LVRQTNAFSDMQRWPWGCRQKPLSSHSEGGNIKATPFQMMGTGLL
jgi:hypothetical protein